MNVKYFIIYNKNNKSLSMTDRNDAINEYKSVSIGYLCVCINMMHRVLVKALKCPDDLVGSSERIDLLGETDREALYRLVMAHVNTMHEAVVTFLVTPSILPELLEKSRNGGILCLRGFLSNDTDTFECLNNIEKYTYASFDTTPVETGDPIVDNIVDFRPVIFRDFD